MKVALIQYWLVSMRGGEAVLEALCRMFPQADIFTHCLCKEKISPVILKHKIAEGDAVTDDIIYWVYYAEVAAETDYSVGEILYEYY